MHQPATGQSTAVRYGLSAGWTDGADSAVMKPGFSHPATSAMICTGPLVLSTNETSKRSESLQQLGWPSCTVTWLATVWPALKLIFEVCAPPLPNGSTVRNPDAAGCVTVTLSTAAVAPAPTAGCGSITSSIWPGSTACAVPVGVPVPSRVSSARVGCDG